VYGTGWYYPPYWGRWYYPRPPTWGFHVGYNPWTGWNYGVSWSNGFFSFGASWGGGWGGVYRPWGCCGGWYGGGYHRGPTIINTGDTNIGNNISVGNRNEVRNKIEAGDRSNRDRVTRENIYERPENRNRQADRAIAQRDLQRARPATGRTNDVYADKSGNVARYKDNQWEARANNSWQVDRLPDRSNMPATRDARPSNLDRQELNRAHNARNAGASRERMHSIQRGGGGRRR